jgi:hypothetical protein
LQRLLGCANCCLSCAPLCARQLWCIVITSTPSTCLRTLFSISAPNMWRLIYTLFGSALHLVIFVSSMSQQHLSLPTYSPRGCLRQSSRRSGLVSTSTWPTLWLRGVLDSSMSCVCMGLVLGCLAGRPWLV